MIAWSSSKYNDIFGNNDNNNNINNYNNNNNNDNKSH